MARTHLLILVLAASLVAIGCGGSSEGEPGGAGAGEGDPAASQESEGSGGPGAEELQAAVDRYRSYAEDEADALIERTRSFATAVEDGEVAGAKELYPPARIPWERIEPIAATLGSLDPEIDARAGDLPPDDFGGFHRLEQALWVRESTAGMAPIAHELVADVERLREELATVELEAPAIATGAVELLGEVSQSKITGEEERYSHTDLNTIKANVEGSRAAFRSVEPLIADREAELVDEIDRSFDDLLALIEEYRRGEGFVSYTDVSTAERRDLSRAIDALAQPLSEVPPLLEG